LFSSVVVICFYGVANLADHLVRTQFFVRDPPAGTEFHQYAIAVYGSAGKTTCNGPEKALFVPDDVLNMEVGEFLLDPGLRTRKYSPGNDRVMVPSEAAPAIQVTAQQGILRPSRDTQTRSREFEAA
jgi:hypothetical protein